VLKAKGFTEPDIAFSALVGEFLQALRSGEMSDTSPGCLTKAYPQLAQRVKEPPDRGGWNLDASSLDEFRRRYKDM
jgi:hypothetical protein